MPKNTVWIGEAEPEEQGSFCNTNSGHEYLNGNLTDAVEKETGALERGDEVIWLDAPIDQRDDYEVQPGQGFNIFYSQDDGQGLPSPSKYGPGY